MNWYILFSFFFNKNVKNKINMHFHVKLDLFGIPLTSKKFHLIEQSDNTSSGLPVNHCLISYKENQTAYDSPCYNVVLYHAYFISVCSCYLLQTTLYRGLKETDILLPITLVMYKTLYKEIMALSSCLLPYLFIFFFNIQILMHCLLEFVHAM